MKEYKIILKEDDYRDIMYFNFYKRSHKMKYVFVCAIISLILIIIGLRKGIENNLFSFIISLVVIIMLIVQFVMFEQKLKRLIQQNKEIFNRERTMTFDDNGIQIESLESENILDYKYNIMKCAFELEKQFLIESKNGKALIIPKMDLKEDSMELRKQLKKNLSDNFKIKFRG